MRVGGYSEDLVGVLREYAEKERTYAQRIRHYLAWPIWQRATDEIRTRFNDMADLTEMPAPKGAPILDDFDPELRPEHHALNAESLTMMRERMTTCTHARVVLGGRTIGHTSRYPGVAEEAYLAARADKPLYIMGGFGGCAGVLADIIRGVTRPELTREHQLEHTNHYGDLVRQGVKIDYGDLIDTLMSGDPRAP